MLYYIRFTVADMLDSYRHQLNHTPKQIYSCDFPDCVRTFVRLDLCNRHRDRHNVKGSQLHRKDSMLGHGSPATEKSMPSHGSASPEVVRPNAKSRTSQLQYQSPQEINPISYSPVTNTSSGTYSGAGSTNGTEAYGQAGGFKRSNSDHIRDSNSTTPVSRPQRHASFGVHDAKAPDFARPSVQTSTGSYGVLNPGTHGHNYENSPQSYVAQQNFPSFTTLPPPTFPAITTAAPVTRDMEPTFPTSMSTDYPSEGILHQQSGPDMMLLDQMAAPNTMPVFGGEGYNRSPFAIPEDFVAYLFSGQHLDNASPLGQMGQSGYAKSVKTRSALFYSLTSSQLSRCTK